MKKTIVLIMILSMVLLCGCKEAANGGSNTTVPNINDPTGEPAGNETNGGVVETTNPIDWETPIDIDDSFLEDQPEATDPNNATEPQATDPNATEPNATEPNATEPSATDPNATEPTASDPAASEAEPTEPQPTRPSDSGSKPIELPMVPG